MKGDGLKGAYQGVFDWAPHSQNGSETDGKPAILEEERDGPTFPNIEKSYAARRSSATDMRSFSMLMILLQGGATFSSR